MPSLPNVSHPYHWSPTRYRLECERLDALGEVDALIALAAAHLGAEWHEMKPTVSVTEKAEDAV